MKPLRLILEVHRATHRIGLFLEAAVPPLDVSQGEAHLLTWLLEAGDSPMSALHAAFAHKRSTLTSYVDWLEAKKLVRRELRAEDRRSFQVCLTAAGKALAARCIGTWRHWRRRCWRRWASGTWRASRRCSRR